jgi:uncharacterized hydrophobic protein (TIGR00271 family)
VVIEIVRRAHRLGKTATAPATYPDEVLVHLRLTLPSALTDDVVSVLRGRVCSTNLTLLQGVSLEPEGDVVEVDVAREEFNEVLADLERLGVGREGGILVTTPTSTPFDAAREIEKRAPGDPDDVIIWAAVRDEAEAGARPTVSFLVFLVLAVILAAIAVILDSSILVVGAMVVGPEFSAIGAIAVGLVFGSWGLVGRSLRLLVAGFLFAVAMVAALSLVARATGLVTLADVVAGRPQTGFIWHPDRWSFIVALVAGAAGALALSVGRSNAMVGVFISVTTIPAAGNLALGLAFWTRHEIVGSALQLGLNLVGMILAGMILAGVLVLGYQRLLWPRTLLLADRLLGPGRQGGGVAAR